MGRPYGLPPALAAYHSSYPSLHTRTRNLPHPPESSISPQDELPGLSADLRLIHLHLLFEGLNLSHWQLFADIFSDTLDECHQIPEEVRAKAKLYMASTQQFFRPIEPDEWPPKVGGEACWGGGLGVWRQGDQAAGRVAMARRGPQHAWSVRVTTALSCAASGWSLAYGMEHVWVSHLLQPWVQTHAQVA